MARPVKKRFVCRKPKCDRFLPALMLGQEGVTLEIEEYECIRLIDFEGATQEECANHMNLTRTSVTALYAKARAKIADCLVNAKMLSIEGGNYELCHKDRADCEGGCCVDKRGEKKCLN